jgi:hypothetical protein
MRPEALIHTSRKAGILLSVYDGRIAFRPKSRMTPKLLNALKTEKSKVTQLLKFCQLARHVGTDSGVRLDDSEILNQLDEAGMDELIIASREVRQSWAEAIALRLVRHRGVVPSGWTKSAHCYFCGPVYSYHDLHMCSCEWCDMRVTGKWFPQPEQGE